MTSAPVHDGEAIGCADPTIAVPGFVAMTQRGCVVSRPRAGATGQLVTAELGFCGGLVQLAGGQYLVRELEELPVCGAELTAPQSRPSNGTRVHPTHQTAVLE